MRTEMRYGKRITQLREERGWTQEQLASIAGLDVRTIQRIEKDVTKGSEALMAIASAFDVTVTGLGRKYWLRESKPLRALTIRASSDFAETMRRANHFFSYCIFGELKPEIKRVADSLIQEIFADIWAMSADEPDLVRTWCNQIEGPLRELDALGVSVFSIQERRDVFLRDADGKPMPFEDCATGYYVIVPRHAAFHLGGPGSQSAVHRFNEACADAVKVILDVLKKPQILGLSATAVHLAQAAGGEDKLQWCNLCFPKAAGGIRLGWEYLECVLGMKKEEMLLLIAAADELPIVGLA